MDRIVKVFCAPAEQAALAKAHRAIERYAAFVLLELPAKAAKTLARRYPIEDITPLYTIETGERRIDTARPRVDGTGRMRAHPAYRDVTPLPPGKHHYLVQFVGPVKSAWLKAVKDAGGEPREPYENFVYVVRASEKQRGRIAALPVVRWVGHLPHAARLARGLTRPPKAGSRASLPRTIRRAGVLSVEFFGPEDLRSGVGAIRRLGFKVLSRDVRGRIAIVTGEKTDDRGLARLSAVHGVRAIRARALKRTSNDVAVGVMGTTRSLATGQLGLSGRGETIAVCDTGLDTGDGETIHPDFAGRIAWIKSYPITADYDRYVRNPGDNDGAADLDSGHGTHVAGSVLGSGKASQGLAGTIGPIRGPAHAARLVFQAVEQELDWKDPADEEEYGRFGLAGIPADLGVLFADAYRRGARIHSNSWGGGDPGEYDEQSEQLDRYVWNHRTFCVVVSAGNDGTDSDGDGRINPMSVTSPATAKNAVTVGACENRRTAFNGETYGRWWPDDFPVAPFRNDPMANDVDQVVAFSSRGPTQDGRTKPDVVAPGTFILSTRSRRIAANNKAWAAFPPSKLYFHMGGTSMATPLVAGAVGLIREYLRKRRRIASPSAALMKATLILGAHRLSGYGAADALLDNHQGFGRVDLDRALSPAAPARTELRDVKPGLVTGGSRGFALAVKSNRVGLRIVLVYSDYPGPKLVNNLNLVVTDPDGTRHVGNQPGAQLTMDSRNNVEVASVRRPKAGSWKIEVVGSNVPRGPQPFALAWQAHLD